MEDRERVIKSLTWDHPNSLVVENWVSPAVWQKYRQDLEPVIQRMPDDFTPYPGPRQDYDEMPPTYRQGELYTDPWGCVWACTLNGMQGVIAHHPLAEGWEKLDAFQPPDPHKTDDLAPWDQPAFEARLRLSVQAGKFILAGGERLWERVHFLRGYENTMADLGWGEARLGRLIRLIVDYNIQAVEKYLRYPEVDGVVFGDDWGEQNRLMVSPAQWRETFFAGYREMFQAVKRQGRYVYFHTDGYLLPIVPDLIAAGADVINLQFRPNSLQGIRQACLGKVCVSVDLDRQRVMPWGAPDEVKAHVREIYTALEGWQGGVWVKAGIFPDMPLENILALCQVYEELRGIQPG